MDVREKRTIKLDKKDYLRALLTDTSPSDTPVIFSNEGFYINAHKCIKFSNTGNNTHLLKLFYTFIDPDLNSNLNDADRKKQKKSQSSPYKYRVIKNEHSLRTLSLIHPRNQLSFAEFYKEFGHSINYLCSQSNFSIRAPVKIANSFTIKTFRRNISATHYKDLDIDTLESEIFKKSSSSFFTYKGHTRLYKIYNSENFLELEKKHGHMWLLDISNCFNSIYTHTISWAVKEKEYSKNFIPYTNQFCSILDTLMQRSNNNETNGIPIGAEFSRVFSEIIFQYLDVKIESLLLEKHNLKLRDDYMVYRYVDDYMVFANSREACQVIYNSINDSINSYNLHLSQYKTKKYARPLITEKSNLVVELNEIVKDFDSNLFDIKYVKKNKILSPKKIYLKERFKNAFISRVKSKCIDTAQDYTLTSSYLISVLCNRIQDVIDNAEEFIKKDKELIRERTLILRDAIEVLLDITLFLYSVKPALSASNKLAQAIIYTDRLFKKKLPEHTPFIRDFILRKLGNLRASRSGNETYRESLVTLESLNVLLATAEFDINHLASQNEILLIIEQSSSLSYFEIISLFYYCKDYSIFSEVRERLEASALAIIKDSDLSKSSEGLHLALDLSCCPYISSNFREFLAAKLYEGFNSEDKETKDAILQSLQDTYWFVKWNNVDLYEILERKKLNPVY